MFPGSLFFRQRLFTLGRPTRSSMSKQILKDLPDLIKAEVITEETAEKIKSYYSHQYPPTNRLFIVFGILGALLVSMGIVLIIAHNWDILPKVIKLAIGLLPLLAGQVMA